MESQRYYYLKCYSDKPPVRAILTLEDSEAQIFTTKEAADKHISEYDWFGGLSAKSIPMSDPNNNRGERAHYEQLDKQSKQTGRIY